MASRTVAKSPRTALNHLTPYLQSLINSLGVVPIQTVLKCLVGFMFLVNFRSWPLVWHYRVFLPVVRLKLSYHLVRLRTIFRPRRRKIQAVEDWFDAITPVGADPFDMSVTYRSWAGPDDSDFNGHLSNSSYPKTLDCARFKAALAMFPQFLRVGGWIAIAGTHFNFMREIPMLSSYEVRVSMGAWDHKWFYVLTKYVTKPKKGKGKKHPTPSPKVEDTPTPPPTSAGALFQTSVHTSANGVSSSESETPPSSGTSNPETAKDLKAVAASLGSSKAAATEPDGAIVHTVAISLCCFKLGRITVPPAFVVAMHGFTNAPPPEAGFGTYSLTNPPPHWHAAKKIMSAPDGGSVKKLRAMLKGGWKDVPEGERWWDTALLGPIEERRAKRLELLKPLSVGIDGAKGL